MIFESLYIKSFGKLVGKSITFGSGVNILEGANESGKSTVCAFIRFMFYGLPSKTEEKLHYISWHTGSAAGSLTLSENGKRYRIEREVTCSTSGEGKNTFRERLAIYDDDTNLVQFKGQSPGEVFFGVSPAAFESTAYIRQKGESKVGGSALGEEAENILFSGSESINTGKALERLDGARAFLLHKNRKGGRIAELENERDTIAAKLDEAKKATGDIIYLEGTGRQLTEKKEDSERRLSEVSAELDTFNRYTVKKACLRSKAEKKRLAELEAKIDALRHDPAHNGRDITEEGFIRSLESKQNALELARSRYTDAEGSLQSATDKLAEMSEKLAIFERFNEAGGTERYISEAKALRRDIKKRKNRGLLFLLGTVVALILAVVFLLVPSEITPIPTYICLALSPVFFIPAMLCFIKNGGKNRRLSAICSKFECKSFAEFAELVGAATKDEAYMVFITSARDDATDKFNLASEQLEGTSTDILEVLRAYGFTVQDNTAASLAEALTVCRETRAELAKLEAIAAEQKERIKTLADDLSSYDEEYLRESLFSEYDEAAMESFHLAAKKRDRDFLVGSINSLTEKLHGIELELATLTAGNFKPTELAEKKALLDDEIETLTRKWTAYVLAIDSIEKASGKLREGISPKIAKNASRLMNAISEGKYDKLGVDLDFSLSFTAEGATRDASYLSAGTGDLAYICLRIALIELLYKKAMPPFIFDESFVRMDDSRLERMMTLIHKYAERGCQSLLFSCHTREKTASDKLGAYTHLSI